MSQASTLPLITFSYEPFFPLFSSCTETVFLWVKRPSPFHPFHFCIPFQPSYTHTFLSSPHCFSKPFTFSSTSTCSSHPFPFALVQLSSFNALSRFWITKNKKKKRIMREKGPKYTCSLWVWEYFYFSKNAALFQQIYILNICVRSTSINTRLFYFFTSYFNKFFLALRFYPYLFFYTTIYIY